MFTVYSSGSQLEVREGSSRGANFSSLTIDIIDDNTKNNTLNSAWDAKMIFPSRRCAVNFVTFKRGIISNRTS